jgi:Mg-chelatase subunit ChlD
LAANGSADTLNIALWVYSQLEKASKEQPKRPGKPKKRKPENGPQEPHDGPTSDDQTPGEGEPSEKAPTGPIHSPVDVEPKSVEPELEGGSIARPYSTDASLRGPRHHIGYPIRGLTTAPVPARLRYEVKRLFDDSGLSDFTRNRKAGVVNVHALPSVAAGSDRVFKRRLEVEGVDSAVVICLDVSGSMFEPKGPNDDQPPLIGPAVQTCRALLDTLDAAGVKTAVLMFGTHISVPKPFSKNAKQASAMLGNACDGGGTSDYAALRHAHQMLALSPERRKIAFVITDGQGRPNAVRQQVASGKALGITTIGVGIKFDVSHIYGQAVKVDDIADLGNASFKQIKLAA